MKKRITGLAIEKKNTITHEQTKSQKDNKSQTTFLRSKAEAGFVTQVRSWNVSQTYTRSQTCKCLLLHHKCSLEWMLKMQEKADFTKNSNANSIFA